MGGRTPLYLASKHNNLQALKRLLIYKANPGALTSGGLNALHVAATNKVRGFLAKAYLLQICMPLIPVKRRQQVWEEEGLIVFKSPDHYVISEFS